MIRVLIVDDSLVFRKILQEALSKNPRIKVVGTASNGREAIQKIRIFKPDVTVLDVEMPEMDGLATLESIKRQHLETVVIMFSSLTSQGAKTTLEALSKGAVDFVPKPKGTGAFSESVKTIETLLIPKIEALGRSANGKRPRRAPVRPANMRARQTPKPSNAKLQGPRRTASAMKRTAVKPSKIEAIGIGVSTGGPNSLNEVIPRFPANFRLPIFLVQHMPPLFTSQLAQRLDQKSKLRVVEAENDMPVRGGTVYIAPGDYHMVVKRRNNSCVVALNQDPPENSCRPAVDVLFRSLAEVYGPRVLAAVLTGMGQDGLEGAKILKSKGAVILAQDKETSVVWGMPKFVAESGLADRVVPLGKIASTIMDLSGYRFQ
ncbi:MAG: chemotaxis response regulator protein-glutamate methylesterase [Thermodesulfobacteria bacterium]|nr:chemotaxis response regulator protein-glutamate methylesterase [Thermodesulfobacteriota bacterium]